jgi:D-alanyl-lipoteichoic acid acyltransferase DltB (MBOAT superfamily)
MQVGGGEGSSNALFIDTYYFWLIAIGAMLALRLITNARARHHVWAGLNLLFLGLVLGNQMIWLLAGAGVLFLLFRAYRQISLRLILTVMIGTTGSAFFYAYKSAFFTQVHGASWIQQLLAGIGFSFVFLRVVDLARSLQDGRYDPPPLDQMINYLLPFHMLAAGPIQAYDDFARQPNVPDPLTTRETLDAAQRVAGGLFKKFVLAYALQKVFLTDLQAPGLWFILEVQILLLWLYLDFSAYSDIAVGLGRLMGVATPENFDRPWLSRNLVEFWDRWHISLSHWIRRNLFIPIQLNLMRRYPRTDPVLIASLAIGVSFFMAGIWHGLSRGWLLWGAIHAIGLVTVRLYTGWMQRRRTPQQIAAYRDNRLILVATRALTIEYAAIAFAVVFMLK